LGGAARLRLSRPLPLRVGYIGLLRDPGEHRIAAGVEVLDPRPPALRRRGAARARADELATGSASPPVCVRVNELRAMGFAERGRRVGDWVVDPQWWAERRQQALTAVQRWSADHDVAAGMPLETLRQKSDLPTAELIPSLLDGAGLVVADGRVRAPDNGLPARVDEAVRAVEERLAAEPFRAPEAADLEKLNLGTQELAAAVRVGRLAKIADGVVLRADVFARAAEVLRSLAQPFTVAEAKNALKTTRRVAVPLLEALDKRGVTTRGDDGTRTLAESSGQ
jgi:selenocysteine-specific elongation factor